MKSFRRPSPAELSQMSHAEKDALIMKLFDLLEGLEKRLSEVEREVEKTSRNSGKPPSSDGLKRQAAEPREPGRRPNGEQPGHTGVTRAWSDTPDQVRVVRPESVCGCGRILTDQPDRIGECRQPIEIPEPKAEVIEYSQFIVSCARRCEHRGVFRPGVGPHVSYGPRLKAYAVGMVDGHFAGLARVDAKQAVATARAAGESAVEPTQVADLLARYDHWVNWGLLIFPERPKDPGRKGRPKQDPAPHLLRRMRDFKTEILRFLHDFRVPLDNNRAERLVRPVKVKLKVAGGFRALGGSAAFCVLRSVWETN